MATRWTPLAPCEPHDFTGSAGHPLTWSAHLRLTKSIRLTSFGFLAGEALLESNTIIDHVYCSPSLRCVQTAHNILKGRTLRLTKKMNYPIHVSQPPLHLSYLDVMGLWPVERFEIWNFQSAFFQKRNLVAQVTSCYSNSMHQIKGSALRICF